MATWTVLAYLLEPPSVVSSQTICVSVVSVWDGFDLRLEQFVNKVGDVIALVMSFVYQLANLIRIFQNYKVYSII